MLPDVSARRAAVIVTSGATRKPLPIGGSNLAVWPGDPYPLGAQFDGSGTNFSVFSGVAERVELCLFDESDRETRIDLTEVTNECWHGYVPSVEPGQRYGYRVTGSPGAPHRCNPHKLLLDPYARAVAGDIRWGETVYDYRFDDPARPNDADDAADVPKSLVCSPYFDWDGDSRPRIPWQDTIVYELHVKGYTKLHPAVPEEQRGTYAGLAHPAVLEHLTNLGITTVELMPVHQYVDDHFLVERGLRNYWGYNSIGYFAPHNRYSSRGDGGNQVQEFKQMVKDLHHAGLEVILDVVYNHTAEGNHLGPVLSFRGFDNGAYYRLDDQGHTIDYTGCGNSLNMRNPFVLQLIMDSLRYWVSEMHVDGFRFDLAAALARELHDVDRLSAFFDLIQQDPVIRTAKLIAEPWDIGEGGYQVGNFPPLWSEWNGKYRDTVRDYWRGSDRTLSEFAYRLSGSSDLYESSGRRPSASVNFVTAHDGFTLHDLVSYNEKHNEANGFDNTDGPDDNRSWNSGVEGPTEDLGVLAFRERRKRDFVASLLLSQGVPMILAGDEIGRTQRGNNNAFCQDNEISWLDWSTADLEWPLLEWTQRVIKLRREHPVFRRRRWFQGRPLHGSGVTDIGWYRTDGEEMSEEDWSEGFAKALMVFLNGDVILETDRHGQPVRDDSFLLLFNGAKQPVEFVLPAGLAGHWLLELDSAVPLSDADVLKTPGTAVIVEDMAMCVLRRV